ncbi:IucA/IucC family protein, partial [Streptomyces sp. AC627_RSS907]
ATSPPDLAEVARSGDGASEADRAHRGTTPGAALDPGEEEIYPVEGAQGSAYGGDGAPPGAYDTTGALDSAYGAADGVADATAALADAFSAEHAAGYGAGEEADGAAYGAPEGAAGSAELVGRVADSVRRTAAFLVGRRAAPGDPVANGAFLSGEQSLLFGHPLHPTPKSRDGLSEAEARAYSPELRGSFPLHWLAVRPSVLAADSAWTERGRTVPAERLVTLVAGAVPA